MSILLCIYLVLQHNLLKIEKDVIWRLYVIFTTTDLSLLLYRNTIDIVVPCPFPTKFVMHFTEKSVLELISRCRSLRVFKQIQTQLISRDLLCDEIVVNKVVTFLCKSADFASYSCMILHSIRSVLSSFPYNTLLSNYAACDKPKVTIFVYRTYLSNGFSPDMFTFPPVFKACGKFSGIVEGKQIHGVVTKTGFSDDMYVQNSLVHLYGVCGESDSACKVFDQMPVRDVVSWTGIITGFTRTGLYTEALDTFSKMDVQPNLATYVCALVASGRVGCLSLGQGIHGLILKRASLISLETGNALIDMYVKCEQLSDAIKVFDGLQKKDKVSWNSMISGLVQCKRSQEAIELFSQMQTSSGVKPDGHILTSVLSACASLGAVDHGRRIHEYVVSAGIKWDTHIGTAIVDMYAKCGFIETALEIFNGIRSKNVFTWNALLSGLAIHGYGHESLRYFEEMVNLGFKPNQVTFLAILNACCHSGLVDEGRKYFNKMKTREYKLSPKLEHYGCLIDMLCRAGLLDEALELVKSMPVKPDVRICGAILSACKSRGTLMEFPKVILDSFLEMEFEDSGVYVLLSNIFAANRRWDEVSRIRRLMKVKGISKIPGSSATREVHDQ